MSYGFTLGLVCKATFEDGDERSDYCKRTAQPHVLITGHDAGDNAGNIDPSAAFNRGAENLLHAAASLSEPWVSSWHQTYTHDRNAVWWASTSLQPAASFKNTY